MDPLISALALGFLLGLQHATDADHLVAVATIVTRERRFASGALVGAYWAVGHMTTLGFAGILMFALNLRLPPGVATSLELLVAAMLVALGAWRLIDVARGAGSVSREHVMADHVAHHEHGNLETVHSHVHTHAVATHRHPHVHPSRRLLRALGDGMQGKAPSLGAWLRPLAVGAVHGMAGSAAVSLLVLATIRSVGAAVAYLALFGIGTVAGMTALTALMAYPVALALRFERARRALGILAGAGSIVFGVLYGYRVM
ncbi:MAG: high-affinity nickel-transport family protein [Candidatus Rokuibacteriota bacterium]|nr:MAG: high-affinity nickel-transport family protein [Candidatus Rokubacteria bacterium]